MRYNLTTQEVSMLLDACTEYIEVFGEAEGTQKYVEYMLDNGLGSAIGKLGKGRRIGDIYAIKYPRHRENYRHPTYEEYCEVK